MRIETSASTDVFRAKCSSYRYFAILNIINDEASKIFRFNLGQILRTQQWLPFVPV